MAGASGKLILTFVTRALGADLLDNSPSAYAQDGRISSHEHDTLMIQSPGSNTNAEISTRASLALACTASGDLRQTPLL